MEAGKAEREFLTGVLVAAKLPAGLVATYAAALASDGFDTFESLRTLSEEDAREAGLKKGHARLLVQTVARFVSSWFSVWLL